MHNKTNSFKTEISTSKMISAAIYRLLETLMLSEKFFFKENVSQLPCTLSVRDSFFFFL